MISTQLKTGLEQALSGHTGRRIIIQHTQYVSGGSINQALKVHTEDGAFFVKLNDAKAYPGMFEAEAKGLKLLQGKSPVMLPEVLLTGTVLDSGFIVLAWIEQGRKAPGFWEQFGSALALTHRIVSHSFGLDHDNYIGSLPQQNSLCSSWTSFFTEQRLEPLLRMAYDAGKCSSLLISKFEALYKQLDSIYPPESPALLHGDLWSGNFMTGMEGQAVLIDPAVYYGHREMDIAMTHLFGGFEQGFYEGYQQEFPLEKDFQSRVDICNLYPLMVHVNLFGGSYLSQVEGILKRF